MWISLLSFAALFVLFLYLYQRKMIYFPTAYPPIYRQMLPEGAVELTFRTDWGRQAAYYLPPRSGYRSLPDPLWVLFNGNAATALDWLETLEKTRNTDAGFLLVDYPGYGVCEGGPTREGIRANGKGAFQTLADHLDLGRADLEENLNVLGLSIGTGTGLDFAAAHPVNRVILLAPFTDLVSMARRSVGFPLCHLLLDRYDNAARIEELLARESPPSIHIYHGDADEVIPFSMGLDLAARHPQSITFHPVKGSGHNDLLLRVEKEIAARLDGAGEVEPDDE